MPQVIKNKITQLYKKARIASIERMSFFFCQKAKEMRKKGETGERDRAKPQPRKKKEREDARKKKKLARDERQQSRQA
jgi:hypothetical protein